MMKNFSTRDWGRIACFLSVGLCAQPLQAEDLEVEETLVLERQSSSQILAVDGASALQADSGSLLAELPGADAVRNGPLTSLVQYRGSFGKRVAVGMGGSPILGGGPNAMDAPLSYAPPALLDSLEIHRGIAPVSCALETMGACINLSMPWHEPLAEQAEGLSGRLITTLSDNNKQTRLALRSQYRSDNALLGVSLLDEGGDDQEFDGGTLAATRYDRRRFDAWGRVHLGDWELGAWVNDNDTGDSGTPALPMDIRYIDTGAAGLSISGSGGENRWSLSIGATDVEHLMDNFGLRHNGNAMRMRENRADADAVNAEARVTVSGFGGGNLSLGLDYLDENHDSIISNPTMAAFRIDNFKDVERQVVSAFSEWEGKLGTDVVLMAGARYKSIDSSAGQVGFAGLNPMMSMAAMGLAEGFNNSDRSKTYSDLDWMLAVKHMFSEHSDWQVGLASKSRAPAYQELYLWIPMQATGGLADGKTYVGNLDLDSERSFEITVGMHHSSEAFRFAPSLFFRRIEDFIQGQAIDNMQANGLATMMSGSPALQFANVDAELWGLDLYYGLTLTASSRIEGQAAFVRGRNVDNGDDLYRIAPANHRVSLIHESGRAEWRLESHVFDGQQRVSSYNSETVSSGYGFWNARLNWRFNAGLRLSVALENLTDRRIQNHLAGVNRAAGSGVAVGERMIAPGRSLTLQMQLNW